jgi:DNA-binding LacI/PurR family transcriptional regulator
MTTRARPVTSADVAKAAGVSRTTVSLVLNGVDTIALADTTKDRVRRIARELGYVPHSGARALRSGYTGIVLMPSGGTALGRIVAEWATHLEDALNALGLTFVVFGSRGLTPVDAARTWSQFRPAAVLTLGSTPLTTQAAEVLRANGTRALLATGEGPIDGTHVIVTGQADAGAIAVEHLRARGKQRLAVVLPQVPGLEKLGKERYVRAVATSGRDLIAMPMAYDRDSALVTARECLRRGVEGVFAFDDDFALLLLGAFRSLGADVPGQVAVVGADDLVAGTLSVPPLTTVRIQFPPAVEVAATVDQLLRGEAESGGITYAPPPELVVRTSS